MTKEEPLTTKNFRGVFLETFEPFAASIARGFQDIHKQFEKNVCEHEKIIKMFEKNTEEHAQIRRDILNLDFKVSELVRRDEFMKLVERVEKLETLAK